ncbi:MAG TPA: glycosyltransferase family A protein [Terriglobales bacterium]|nr:glycosyltransferase family A protein [Terriglobales bacterium]
MSLSAGGTGKRGTYVLITAAHNEENYIERTIVSIVSQTLSPKRWVIVSDGSTDRTEEIVARYAKKYPFIQLLALRNEHKRNFGAQVHAINAGYGKVMGLDFDFIGNVDADVSFGPDYFRQLTEWTERNPDVGLTGGFIYEEVNGTFRSRFTNRTNSIAHAVQFFRRECYQAIGGYIPLPCGGPDWCAEIMTRMKGWRAESLPWLPVFHHRPTGGGIGVLRYAYQQGFLAYSLGSHPFFEVAKCVPRIKSKPYVLVALTGLVAFALASVRRKQRPVAEAFVAFLRKEQMRRLREFILHPFENAGTARKERSLRLTPRPTRK